MADRCDCRGKGYIHPAIVLGDGDFDYVQRCEICCVYATHKEAAVAALANGEGTHLGWARVQTASYSLQVPYVE